MARLDDEVQREMTRYCAGIDQWDAMPVVVEGWLRVFEGLQQQLGELRRCVSVMHETYCEVVCPGRGDHVPDCMMVRRAIVKAEGK